MSGGASKMCKSHPAQRLKPRAVLAKPACAGWMDDDRQKRPPEGGLFCCEEERLRQFDDCASGFEFLFGVVGGFLANAFHDLGAGGLG